MTKKIFISYRSTERKIVKEFAEILDSFGDYETWWDTELLPGDKWWKEIIRNLQSADIVIVMISRAYWESEPCELERNYATKLNIPIIPVKIDAELNFLGEFAETQYHRFYNHQKIDKISQDELQAALKNTQLKPKPEPLPEPPKAPISLLVDIQIELNKRQLPGNEQKALLDKLRWHPDDNPHELGETIDILHKFSKHTDRKATVEIEIVKLIAEFERQRLDQIAETLKQSSELDLDEKQQFFNYLKLYQDENPELKNKVNNVFRLLRKHTDSDEELHGLINNRISASEPIVDVSDSLETVLIIEEEIDTPEEGRANNRPVYVAGIGFILTTIIVASVVFQQIGQRNTNATATQQIAIVLAETEAQSTQDSIDTATADAIANDTQNSIDMTANAMATQEAISTSEAQATADTVIAETSNAQAIIEASATQEAIDTATANAVATQEAISTANMQTEVAFAENEAQATQDAIATENQAIIEAGETQNAMDTATANAVATFNANNTATAIAQVTIDTLVTQNANSSATANAQATLTAIPTITAVPSSTLPPYAISLANYNNDWQSVVQELREIGMIGSQGQLLFEESNVFVQGQGSLYQALGSNTPIQNVILSAEIHLESDSSEIETCALQIRVQENAGGLAVTSLTVGFINDGQLYVDEFLDNDFVGGKRVSASVDIEENNHLIVLAVDNLLIVYLNGEPVVQNHVIDEHDGTAGLSIIGQNSSSRCEAENLWAYEVQ